ncbi:MAG: hypothetical protein ABFS35_21490 [Bacteroidota bacterium]
MKINISQKVIQNVTQIKNRLQLEIKQPATLNTELKTKELKHLTREQLEIKYLELEKYSLKVDTQLQRLRNAFREKQTAEKYIKSIL